MKSIAILFVISCLSAAGFACHPDGPSGGRPDAPPRAHAGGPSGGFAVVELFTSEGCSSCPPADELVAKIQMESNTQPVYILAFHVDYWNHLGWKDVFSDAAWSKRQGQYAEWLHLPSVYTPQIVVNGRTEFVGSEEGKLRKAIKTNLTTTPVAQVILKERSMDASGISLEYQTEGAKGNNSLLLALVQKSATTEVKRGENSGHTLSHVQIVRGLDTIDLSAAEPASGTVHINLPSGLKPQDCEVIAFIQDHTSGAILAAASTASALVTNK